MTERILTDSAARIPLRVTTTTEYPGLRDAAALIAAPTFAAPRVAWIARIARCSLFQGLRQQGFSITCGQRVVLAERYQLLKLRILRWRFDMQRLKNSSSQNFSVTSIVALLLLMVLGSLSVQGQTISGRISGTVKDNNGGAVPNATVTITNAATNLVRTVTTDEDGFYTATNLPVGTYTILIARDGFKKAQQAGVVLAADARLTQDMTLEVGQLTETVQVSSGVGETVNTTSGEVARVVDQRQVQNLALNGRNYMQLVTLIPGAVILDEDQLALTTSLSISQASVNGNRPNYNSLSVDGGFNMDSGSNNSQVNNVGIDFVQEVKIETSNFSAEYGRNAGAAINIVTRGGGNSFHGAAFEFLRNDKLDARNFFSPVKAKLRFNDFGWNFNGPIKKDKLFFFVGQEYKRIRQDTAPVKRSLPTRA
ncbi:MAG TPA: carboxypeptidase-like regulatory domain-containing protein, partial [Pyrinomonadaceae bacterium]|nr:carboxypeptidase-like regulatory domain-containing protein [Pyrinomonadaceae bacterium]